MSGTCCGSFSAWLLSASSKPKQTLLTAWCVFACGKWSCCCCTHVRADLKLATQRLILSVSASSGHQISGGYGNAAYLTAVKFIHALQLTLSKRNDYALWLSTIGHKCLCPAYFTHSFFSILFCPDFDTFFFYQHKSQ